MCLSKFHLDQTLLVAVNTLLAEFLANLPGTDLTLKHNPQFFNKVDIKTCFKFNVRLLSLLYNQL